MANVYSRAERWKAVHSWARIDNFLLLYSYTHNRFSTKCRSIAENENSGGLLLDWLEQEEYLRCVKTTHEPTVTVAQELIDNQSTIRSR